MLSHLSQERGGSLSLEFNKGSARTFAGNLRPVLKAIDGYYLSGCVGGSDRPNKETMLIPSIEPAAADFLRDHQATLAHRRGGAESRRWFRPRAGLELTTAVHWLANRGQSRTIEDMTRHAMLI